MSESRIDPLSLDKSMPPPAQQAILLLVQARPHFESALTDWLIAVSGMKRDIGVLMIGRLDVRAKIDKLKEIFAHIGDAEQVRSLKNLGRSAEGYSKVRNTIIHCHYIGHRTKPDTTDKHELIYSTSRPTKGQRDRNDAVVVTLDDLRKTASFALRSAKTIRDGLQAWDG